MFKWIQQLKLPFIFKKNIKCPWCGCTPKYSEAITYKSSVTLHELFCDNEKCMMEVSCIAESKKEVYDIWKNKRKKKNEI